MADTTDYFYTWSAQSQVSARRVTGGHGVWLETEDGEFLDLGSLSYQAHLGYAHPRLTDALRRQLDSLPMAPPNAHTEAKAAAAARILRLCGPDYSRVFFSLGGAEAVENAMKMARLYTGKLGYLARRRSYHGATFGALSLTGDYRRPPLLPLLPGVLRAADCHCSRCPFDKAIDSCARECASDIERLIRASGDQVAAVFAEPIVGANGVLIPPDDYWPKLREICDATGTLLVADEVLTGLGRTGSALAVKELGGQPDMIVLAKGLTAGYAPLGAVVVHRRIADHFDDEVLYAGLTHYGHPLGCAAAAETLAIYEDEKLFARARSLEPKLLNGLRDIANKLGEKAFEVRGRGLLAALEMSLSEGEWGEVLARLSAERLIVHAYPARGTVVLAPALNIAEDELAEGLRRLSRALRFD